MQCPQLSVSQCLSASPRHLSKAAARLSSHGVARREADRAAEDGDEGQARLHPPDRGSDQLEEREHLEDFRGECEGHHHAGSCSRNINLNYLNWSGLADLL